MSKIDNLLDDSMDDRIRLELHDAQRKGKLGVVAAVTGIAGGVEKLRKLITSTEPLSIMDRGMLSLYFKSEKECYSIGYTALLHDHLELCGQRDAALKLAKELCHRKAHTYASKNADLYRGFDNGCEYAGKRIEAIFSQKKCK